MKTYKGYELYKMIAEGKVKNGAKVKLDGRTVYFNGKNFRFEDTDVLLVNVYDDISIAQMDFELIKDEIDIQEQEINWEEVGYAVGKIYTTFVKGLEEAVKQLDKNKEDKQC